jgi:hypothetical protein
LKQLSIVAGSRIVFVLLSSSGLWTVLSDYHYILS